MTDDASSRKSEDVSFQRVKLMCSHGGKILPRPHDNQLRYVGGETHILVVPRNISFADLMSKFTKLYGGSVVPKYQLPGDELDVLVSILGSDDLAIMMEEFDKLYSRDSSARIRVFLFPPKQQKFLEPLDYTRSSEQEFLDAVNGLSFQSRRNSYPLTYTQGFDFLFGLDALANQEGKSTDLFLKSSIPYSTSSTLPISVSGKEFTSPLHSIAFSQQVVAVSVQENTSEKHITDIFAKKKPIDSTSVMTMQTGYSSDNDLSNNRTYSPLTEASRDQLSKGMIPRQYDDSLPGSLDSPVFRHSGDDLSDFSDLSLEEIYDRNSIVHSHSKEYIRSPGKEDMVSGFCKSIRDHVEVPMDLINYGPKTSFGLRGRSSSDGWLNLLDSNADLTAERRHNGTESVRAFIDHHNLDMSSGGQTILDSNGKRAVRLERREADHFLPSNYGRQNMQSHSSPNNQMSCLGCRLAEDDHQRYRDGAEALPHNLVFLPRPGSMQSPAPSSMPRVASAPNVMKLSGDALPPRYVAVPHTTQSSRQYDKPIPGPRFVPSSARAAHRSPSRFRDSSPIGSRQQA